MTGAAAGRATSSQQRASDPRASAWVSANAGSGKTHVLANRVIRLLLEGTDPQKVLCLTFTKAAAAEMANRIFKTLGDWVPLDDEALIDRIQDISGRGVVNADRLVAARRLFARALETPGGLKVQTIHAFCEGLLQRFPLEADVAPGFEVLDERVGEQVLAGARAGVLADAAEAGHALNAVLKSVVARLQPADFDTVLNELLRKRRASRTLAPDACARQLRALHGLDREDTAESAIADALSRAGDTERYRTLAGALAHSGKQDREAGERISRYLSVSAPEPRFLALSAVFLNKALQPRSNVVTKGFAGKHADLADWLDEQKAAFIAAYARFKAASVCAGTQALLAIADRVIERYETAKRERGLLDYDDLITRTLDLFTSSGADWVLYKLDGGLDHILVDEAQDTSPEQWQVIRHLAEEFFSGAGARDVIRTVFAVGDEKQSIFSFQGADPAQFEEMQRYFRGRVEEAQAGFERVELTVSFRSTSTVLRAVDLVFETPAAAKGVSRGGVPPHEAQRAGQPGLVEIWPTVKPADEPEEEDHWDPVDRESPSSARNLLAEKIARTIEAWLRSGEMLKSRNRPIRPGDILILVRRRNSFVDAMVRELKRLGIPVAGADRLVLTDHIAVMDLLALARFVLLPGDDLTLATVLKSPLLAKPDGRPFDDADLFSLAHGRAGPLWTALQEKAREPGFADAVEHLAEWRGRAGWQRPYEFFSHLLAEKGIRTRFVERLGTEANDPIDEFLNLALQFEQQNVPSLQGFVDWMGVAEAEIKRDMEHGTDEVRVMTVHGAKGLEANVVFLPDTCAAPDWRHDPKILELPAGLPGTDVQIPVWPIAKAFETAPVAAAREAYREGRREEYNRLLYVAMTRACDRLYVCGYETRQARDAGCWYDMIRSALESHASAHEEDGELVLRLEDETADASEVDRNQQQAGHLPAEPPHWAMCDPPPQGPATRVLAPSRLDLAADDSGETAVLPDQPVLSPLAGAAEDRFRRGRLIHTLLQTLPDLAPADRLARGKRFLEQAAADISESERAEIMDAVRNVLEHPAFGHLFAPGSRAEVPVAGRLAVTSADGQDIVISGQVDRLAVTGDEVLIVDYKTNRPAARSLDEAAPLYVRQLAAYRLALMAVFPGRAVRGFLLWTDGPHLMEIPADVLDGALPVG